MSTSTAVSPNNRRGHSSPWRLEPDGAGDGALRLFCFASAGGSAELYRQWQEHFGGTLHVCPVELPGRGRRMGEPFIPSLAEAAEASAEAIGAPAKEPFALFGHSLGSIIALETARILEHEGRPPQCLFVSGYGAPHRYREAKGLHLAPDASLVDELRRYGGTPEAVLSNQDFLQYMLPILRDDYRLLETHVTGPHPLLDVPVCVCCGDADPDVSAESLGWWRELTQAGCSTALFPGDHFYFQTDPGPLLRHIAEQLRNPERLRARQSI